MTEQQHPITPPLMLRRLWAQQAQRLDPHDPVAWMEHVSTQAARWGAGQELEACVEWLVAHGWFGSSNSGALCGLRAARRPKPPSLAERALQALNEAVEMSDDSPPEGICANQANTIRAALKRLQELEKGNE